MFVRRYIQKVRYGADFSFTCVLLAIFINDITALSLDRLSINYNDVQQIDKQQQQLLQDSNNNFNKNSLLDSKSVVIDNTQYLPLDLNNQSNLIFVSARHDYDADNEDEQIIDNNFLGDTKLLNVDTNNQNDMVMLESQDEPVKMLQLSDEFKKESINEIKDTETIITTNKQKQSLINNNEQLRDKSEEIEYELHQINESLTDDFFLQDKNVQGLVQEKGGNKAIFKGESISLPMIEVAQEGKAPDVYNKNFKEDTPSSIIQTEIPIKNNRESSLNVLENQLQENSEKSEISQDEQFEQFNVNSHEVSKVEDYMLNEEDMPEECGEEYYMNPNQETSENISEFASNSKEITKPLNMELEIMPSKESFEEVGHSYDLKKVIQTVSNFEKGWNVSSTAVPLTHISEMDAITTRQPLIISSETESMQLTDETIKSLYMPNEQVVVLDNVKNSEVISKLMEQANAMGNQDILLNPVAQILPKIMDEPSEIPKTTKENLYPENENVNNKYAISSQWQQQNLSGMAVKKVEPTELSFNSNLRRYDGAQVWRIVVQNDKERKLADNLNIKFGGQLWKEVKQEVDYLLKPQVLAQAEEYVKAANLSRIVLIDNLQEVIEVENPPAEQIAQLQNRKGHRLTWQAYHRLDDIHGFFDYLAKTYSDICSIEIIGYSIEKRPLKILKISNGEANNTGIWIDGGIHAREWISPAVVTYIANHIVEGWDDLPGHMRKINWYIHAVVNPDGYEYSHTTDRLWRKNMRSHGRLCPGVDLNRNFGYMWGGRGTSANPCSQIYRGTKAFSEPEAFYISKFISGFPKGTFKAYLSFHSYGQYILYPWGYDYLETNDTMDLDLLARQAGTNVAKSTGVKYTVGAAANTLYAAAGGSDDWAKGIAEIKYTYTIEMGDTGRYGFVLPASEIECNGKNAYTMVQTISHGIMMGKYGRRRQLKVRHN